MKGVRLGRRGEKKDLLELVSLQLAGGDGFLNACETRLLGKNEKRGDVNTAIKPDLRHSV